MREPFPYETNAFLISTHLVPDPLSLKEFSELEAGWNATGRHDSLLEWIIEESYLSEFELMKVLEKSTGRRYLAKIIPLTQEEWDSGAQFFENNGFTPGRDQEGKPVVTGGAGLPPNLKEILGEKWSEREWVLTSPVRKREGLTIPSSRQESKKSPTKDSRLVERLTSLLVEAATNGASDIYMERYGDRLTIRAKTPRGMSVLGEWSGLACTETLRLLKRWSNLSTSNVCLPQDGRMALGHLTPAISYRVSHVHSVNGESLVLRTIGRESALPGPKQLGIPHRLSHLLRDCLLYEHGLVLCSGITGSGKTTTMCSIVSSLKEHQLKILTIEDPVEYELSNATQSTVNQEQGWTFPAALGAYLRQDPDIILIGEIRDRESALMASQAGLTGHCVISSLHARSPAAAFDRLRAWNLSPGLIAESIRLVIHQRLNHDTSGEGRTASFNWIHPDSDEIYDYLVKGTLPSGWTHERVIPDQEAFPASATN